jgi:hypothetical protein
MAKVLAIIDVIGSTSKICLVSTAPPVNVPTTDRSDTTPLIPNDEAVGRGPVICVSSITALPSNSLSPKIST